MKFNSVQAEFAAEIPTGLKGANDRLITPTICLCNLFVFKPSVIHRPTQKVSPLMWSKATLDLNSVQAEFAAEIPPDRKGANDRLITPITCGVIHRPTRKVSPLMLSKATLDLNSVQTEFPAEIPTDLKGANDRLIIPITCL